MTTDLRARTSFSASSTRLEATSIYGLLALLLSISFPGTSLATERETYSTITRLYTWTQLGGGDVVVQVANAAPVCTKGFWLKPSDAGFKTTYALLLSAYLSQTPVRLSGDDTQIWTGSVDVYCRMTFAGTPD